MAENDFPKDIQNSYKLLNIHRFSDPDLGPIRGYAKLAEVHYRHLEDFHEALGATICNRLKTPNFYKTKQDKDHDINKFRALSKVISFNKKREKAQQLEYDNETRRIADQETTDSQFKLLKGLALPVAAGGGLIYMVLNMPSCIKGSVVKPLPPGQRPEDKQAAKQERAKDYDTRLAEFREYKKKEYEAQKSFEKDPYLTLPNGEKKKVSWEDWRAVNFPKPVNTEVGVTEKGNATEGMGGFPWSVASAGIALSVVAAGTVYAVKKFRKNRTAKTCDESRPVCAQSPSRPDTGSAKSGIENRPTV